MKVGDWVTIRRDLVSGKYYDGILFVSGMNHFKGGKLKINATCTDGSFMLENGEGYIWSVEMFEPDIEMIEITV